jgi:hypothetical protein
MLNDFLLIIKFKSILKSLEEFECAFGFVGKLSMSKI